MTRQTLYFPQTDTERKAFDHAIDRVLFHLSSDIAGYEKLMNQSKSTIEESQWRYCMAALVSFKTSLHELFKCEVNIDERE